MSVSYTHLDVYKRQPKKEREAAAHFTSFFGHWVMRGFGRLIWEGRASGLPVGHVGPMQWEDGAQAELTWSLWTAEAEGRGLATEAATAMQAWLFGPLGLTSARAEVHRDNAASHAIARRLGGRLAPDQRPVWMDEGCLLYTSRCV